MYDMIGDLHWYVEPRSRKKGYLGRALSHAILPHLARSRRKQEISIDEENIGEENYNDSLNVAMGAGFRIKRTPQQRTICVQDLKPYKTLPLEITHVGMDRERLAELKRDMSEVVGKLWCIQAEVEMKLGKTYYTRQLQGFVNDLKKYRTLKMEDALIYFEDSQARRKSAIKRETNNLS
ncbi:hypothetical protein DIU31_028175 [Mucilaginibacter rubeus]|uniref:Uncharacterized protein n=1 Tax=Mucilaginibacter rubeus TaxID=2027860 RepID=A0AAE6JKU6_9SPHI|nr:MULTISPECIES: hypothetical protein [Mucilaginibacter]QEM07186.1 hypothetical protein DIU31_028175 [Mucilaginibacter rubeus]QEM19642.1 hypothetical protein DIU38_027750 [Mucilaginibacter gossypii]QTE43664.1 hypothetical protein J3L19_32885 [Mucilaginibacter rubeus]QTE50264.1 hypothetical protein J3L21_32840 [Mucilaginibacter rubeus]QTE65189.1 hypothetical protein J3L22_09365 [Mucilaginibacter rubeus]